MKKTYLLFSIILLIFLIGCSRYDDGPWISFRSAKNRVVGTWQVEKLLIDGLDSTELYREQIGCEWEFTDELRNGEGSSFYLYCKQGINDTTDIGRWYFYEGSKKIIAIDFICANPIGPIGRGGTWDIMRLTNKEMYLWINPPDNFLWGASDETTYYVELLKQ
ncbi:MAG TPA: hypothetical protein P5509_05825 [Bacteroidales bacterium]|nr:hypothetical protein [Bacteroidales bacterium]